MKYVDYMNRYTVSDKKNVFQRAKTYVNSLRKNAPTATDLLSEKLISKPKNKSAF